MKNGADRPDTVDRSGIHVLFLVFFSCSDVP